MIARPGRRRKRFYSLIEYWGSEAIQQRQASLNKKDIDSADAQIRLTKEEDVDVVAVIDGTCLGAPRPEHYLEKLGSTAKGTSLVAEARTSI